MNEQIVNDLTYFRFSHTQIWPYGSEPYSTTKTGAVCPNINLIGNGYCDDVNLYPLCQYDGLDCCLNPSLNDNGECDHSNLNPACGYDGEDCSYCNATSTSKYCCSPANPCIKGHGNCFKDNDCANGLVCGKGNCGKSYPFDSNCCTFEVDEKKATSNPCPNAANIGDNICDPQNNNVICNYDGGDCCHNSYLIRNHQCDMINYNHVCLFDGGDCCLFEYSIGENSGCAHFFQNIEMCNYKGGGCCDDSRIGDGICDDINNNRLCHYDGGDCCFGDKSTDRCDFCKCIEVFNVI